MKTIDILDFLSQPSSSGVSRSIDRESRLDEPLTNDIELPSDNQGTTTSEPSERTKGARTAGKVVPLALALGLLAWPFGRVMSQTESAPPAPRLAEVTVLAPSSQQGTDADRAITRAILEGVSAQEELSPRAGELSITTVDARVTLEGSVNSVEEKATIATVAENVDGVRQVDNRITIRPHLEFGDLGVAR